MTPVEGTRPRTRRTLNEAAHKLQVKAGEDIAARALTGRPPVHKRIFNEAAHKLGYWAPPTPDSREIESEATRKRFEALADQDRDVLAHRATRGRSFIGFILSRLIAGEAEILSVAVASSRRGTGVARRLLDLHLRRLAGLGVRAVFLEVGEDNGPARKLYQRAGFREVGRRDGYYPDPKGKSTAALVLRRDL
jgi:ribosomal protein S18 acetylase RimI-like enzyme